MARIKTPWEKIAKQQNRIILLSLFHIVCLISLGIMIGMQIKPKYKKSVFLGSLSVFAVTYVPLMKKFFLVLTGKE